MGMYTRFVLNVALIKDVPEQVVNIITQMLHSDQIPAAEGLNDPIFQTDRAVWMLRCSSYYHDNINNVSFVKDEISNQWKLSVVCDLKNYENEIELFCNWIAPYVATEEFAGYRRYEETDVPRLLWFWDGKPKWYDPIMPTDCHLEMHR